LLSFSDRITPLSQIAQSDEMWTWHLRARHSRGRRVPRFYRLGHDGHAGASVMLAAKAARGLDLISS